MSATVGGLLRQAKIADFSPEQVQFLTYGRGVDTVRMRERLGFEPKHTTMHAFDSFADARCRDGLLDRDRVASATGCSSGRFVGWSPPMPDEPGEDRRVTSLDAVKPAKRAATTVRVQPAVATGSSPRSWCASDQARCSQASPADRDHDAFDGPRD